MVFKRVLIGLAVRVGVDLVKAAVERYGADDVIDELAEHEDELLERVAEVVDEDDVDAALERVATAYGEDPEDVLWRPVDQVQRLEDDPNSAYLWFLEDGVDPAGFADQLDRIFRQQLGREPRGMHIPLATVDDLREADPEYVERQAAPWLQQAQEGAPERGEA